MYKMFKNVFPLSPPVAKPLYVALAQRKEDRKAHLTSQHMQRIAGMRMQQQMGQVRTQA